MFPLNEVISLSILMATSRVIVVRTLLFNYCSPGSFPKPNSSPEGRHRRPTKAANDAVTWVIHVMILMGINEMSSTDFHSRLALYKLPVADQERGEKRNKCSSEEHGSCAHSEIGKLVEGLYKARHSNIQQRKKNGWAKGWWSASASSARPGEITRLGRYTRGDF
jgi:hypothetical protein